MENFITIEDYKAQITLFNLQDMIEEDELILESAEADALALIESALFQKYDIQTIFSATGNDRPKVLVLYAKYLTLYELYKRLPHLEPPESVKMDATFARNELQDIAQGKKTLPLPRLVDETKQTKTTRKFISQSPRTH